MYVTYRRPTHPPKNIAEVMRQQTELCAHGWGAPPDPIDFGDSRLWMRSTVFAKEFDRAKSWIVGARGAATAMRRFTAYEAKHAAQTWVSGAGSGQRGDDAAYAAAYISEGALIVAALICGYTPTRVGMGRGCGFRK